MTEQWRELKETIIAMRDSDGKCTQQEVCVFLINYMEVLEKQRQEPKIGHWITTRTLMHDGEFYCDRCKCEAPKNKKWDYCPNCGAKMESEDNK